MSRIARCAGRDTSFAGLDAGTCVNDGLRIAHAPKRRPIDELSLNSLFIFFFFFSDGFAELHGSLSFLFLFFLFFISSTTRRGNFESRPSCRGVGPATTATTTRATITVRAVNRGLLPSIEVSTPTPPPFRFTSHHIPREKRSLRL